MYVTAAADDSPARRGTAAADPPPSGLLPRWCCPRGPEETPYEGGCFSASLEFPPDYPMSPVRCGAAPGGDDAWGCPQRLAFDSSPPRGAPPCRRRQPKMRFNTPLFHPNIYEDGSVRGRCRPRRRVIAALLLPTRSR